MTLKFAANGSALGKVVGDTYILSALGFLKSEPFAGMRQSSKDLRVSNDANLRLQLAQEWIEAYSADTEILLVAHSREAADDLLLRVVQSRGAAFGIKRVTLNFIASRLAQRVLAEAGTAPATNLTFTAVVARAIHSLQSKSKLTYFAPVATKPGFPIAVAKTLAELRMNEVATEALARLSRGGKDLAAIAEQVDKELREGKLSDRAVLFQSAIASIDSTENSAFVGLPLLLIDVAVHSRLEERLIEALSERASSVLATVPRGDARSVEALERALRVTGRGGDETGRPMRERIRLGVKKAAEGRRTPKSLELIKEHLFENSAPPLRELDESVHLSNWPGEPRECVEIVRNIQAEATAGVPLGPDGCIAQLGR